MTMSTYDATLTPGVKTSDDSVKDGAEPAKPHVDTKPAVDTDAGAEAERLVNEAMSKEIRVITPGGGSLTFTPHQTALTPEQRAAFQSLGVDPADPVAAAHCRRFVHVCQMWGLDPWGGEIYLVQRGKIHNDGEDKRTWTIQVGIDGYRRRARSTGRWIGTAKWYWTGRDDDEKSWRETVDPISGDIVMRRVWWEIWPESRKEPGAAKAVIQVYGDDGVLRTEEFVAHWEMFAAYENEWRGGNQVYENGVPKQKLAKFWERGKAHMLAKCAEAGLLRQEFAGVFHGVVTAEEMSRDDVDNKNSIEDAVAQRRRDAYRDGQAAAQQTIAETGAQGDDASQIRAAAMAAAADVAERARTAVIQGEVESDPDGGEGDAVRLGEVLAEVAPQMSEADRVRLLLAEVDWISELVGKNLRTHIALRARANIETLDADALLTWVGPLREQMVVPRLREAGRHVEADVYTSWGAGFVGSVAVLTGRADPAADAAADAAQDADSTDGTQQEEAGWVEPHPFDAREDDDSRCSECDGFENDDIHGGTVASPPE